MERLDFSQNVPYNATEACIHLNRYAILKTFCKGAKILDAASGEGYGSYLLKKWGASEVVGVDIDIESVNKANSLFAFSGVKFMCHNVEELPFSDCYFDIVVSFETIEHLDHPDMFLQELRRVVKPGGIIIISCPNDPYYFKEEKLENPFHKKKYTWFDFKDLAEKYLGNNVDYFLGFAVNGFLNIPISRSTEPSDALPSDMMEIMNYKECRNTLYVKQDRYLNHWNSNYYVGIWGGNEIRKDINAVISPREFFCKLKDEDVELLKKIKKWQLTRETDCSDYKEKFDVETLKTERQSLLIELLNKEIECLRQSYDELNKEKNKILVEKQAIEKESVYINNEIKILIHEKSLVDGEIETIKTSKGWKLLTMLYKIEGIFRK